MKITRNILTMDVEIELTPSELYSAYLAQQHEFDRQDIQDLYSWLDPDEIEREWHITKDALDAGLDRMASDLRRNIDKYDMDWDAARDAAFDRFLTEHAC